MTRRLRDEIRESHSAISPLESRIDAYFDRELTPQQCAELFGDLTRHPAALTQVVKDQAILDAIKRPIPTDDLKSSIMERMGVAASDQHAQHVRLAEWSRRMSLAAAAALAICAGLWMQSSAARLPSPAPKGGMVSEIIHEAGQDLVRPQTMWEGIMDTARDIADRAEQDRRGPAQESVLPTFTFPSLEWLRRFDPLHESTEGLDLPGDVNSSGLGPMVFV